jgi:membrane protease YdiL (CAAX protease family)
VTQNPRTWVKAHPIAAFFLLAIALMFGALFPAIYLVPRDNTVGQILGFYLGVIAVYSPVGSGLLVTRIVHPGRPKVPWARRLPVFLPALVVAAVIQTANLKLTAPPSASLIALIGLLALPVSVLPAWVISSAFSGTDGVRRMLATLVRPRGNVGYYLIALLTFPFIHVVGTGITNVRNGAPWLPTLSGGAGLVYTVLVTFCTVLLFAGGLNEEAGWRGFAQHRLQARYSPLVANLFLWFMMVIWHVPNDILQYRNGGYVMVRLALYPCITILLGWIYNRTKGSILAPALFHASMNSMNRLMGMFPITTAGNVLLVGFAVAVVVFDRMWRKLPADHPAGYREGAPFLDPAPWSRERRPGIGLHLGQLQGR